MEHTKLITPSELEDFAARRDSEPVVPELVALLVKLSVPDLDTCRIPYGDAIGLPGLDGLVKTESGFRQFVPKHTSYWEIGRSADPQAKATEDYKKRTDNTSLEERANATFVFVTPRSKAWDQPAQAAWIQRRAHDGWNGVKIIDGVQLCDWVREFPAVGKWLLQRVGLVKALTGFHTPAEHWSHLVELAGKGDPPLPPNIFLVGREHASQQLERVFRHEAQQVILAVESENDAEDFVAAFLASLDEATREAYSSRCLLISDPDAWHTFSNLRFSHVLVASPRLDLADANEQLHLIARTRGHGIVFSVSGAWSHGAEHLIPLRSPSRGVLEKSLLDAGFSSERASEMANAGAQSLAALKRFLRGLGELPPYATWDNARLLAQASLLGKWRGDRAADKEALEILLGKTYGEWIEVVRAETLRADTPLMQRNEFWKLISRGEAWAALGSRITDDDLSRFQEMAVRVLQEKDPQFELPKEERYSASLHGKELRHSRSLRDGVAESLALLGSKPSALSSTSHGKAEGTARRVVRALLDGADWVSWASLNDQMPLLAEAAPDEFLDAIEAAVADPGHSPFVEVFRQEGSGATFGGWNYLTGVLWALETLAWDAAYLGRVTTLLGDLASIDPGGTWANRPRNSLIDIFLPWHVQTLADLPARRAALESLDREHPDVGWNVLLGLLPSSHGVTSGTRRPVWRSLIPSAWKETTTTQDYWEQVRTYAEILTRIAAQQLDKLAQLIDRLPDLPEPARSQVLSHLSSEDVTSLTEEARLPLWEALKDIASKHRKFADTDWALPGEQVGKIEEVAERLEPASLELANRRLFSERDFDLYEEHGDYQRQQDKLDLKRQDAIKTIVRSRGIEAVVAFAKKVESPRKVGDALGAIDEPTADEFLLPSCLRHEDRAIDQFVRSFVRRRAWCRKWPWIDEQLNKRWQTEEILKFLLLMPSERATWQRAENILGAEVSRYWSQVEINPWGMESDDLTEAAGKLAAHGQAAAAIDCLYLLSHKKVPVSIDLASASLLGALSSEDDAKRLQQHHVVEVIKWIQETSPLDSEKLFEIEWHYLPLLNRVHGGAPKVLEYKLATSPKFYCEVIAAVFRSDKEDKDERPQSTELQKRIARNAYSLLHGWRTLPGTRADGSFDGEKFAEWLQEVKKCANESGHLRIAMDQLGQALAYAPADPQGLWIHRAIATALDSKDVAEMRKAFRTGLFNRRGVHGFSHGEEEKQLAASYRAKAKALSDDGFHRAADAVRGLADEYERQAERESQRDIWDDR